MATSAMNILVGCIAVGLVVLWLVAWREQLREWRKRREMPPQPEPPAPGK